MTAPWPFPWCSRRIISIRSASSADLTSNTEQTPYALFYESYDNDHYVDVGWNHETLPHYANKYGIKSKWITNDADAIIAALKEGKPVISHMGPGVVTSRGHYMVLRAGKIL